MAHISTDFAEQSMVCCSMVSVIMCSIVVITFISSPQLLCKRYHEIVFYGIACDLVASIGGTLGLHTEVNASCYTQWFLTNNFGLSSILWTLCILVELFQTMKLMRTSRKQKIYFHVFCWGFPLVFTLLPLTTESVGPPSTGGSGDWCYLVPSPSGELYTWYSSFVHAQFPQVILSPHHSLSWFHSPRPQEHMDRIQFLHMGSYFYHGYVCATCYDIFWCKNTSAERW